MAPGQRRQRRRNQLGLRPGLCLVVQGATPHREERPNAHALETSQLRRAEVRGHPLPLLRPQAPGQALRDEAARPTVSGEGVEVRVRCRVAALPGGSEKPSNRGEQHEAVEGSAGGQAVQVPSGIDLRSEDLGKPGVAEGFNRRVAQNAGAVDDAPNRPAVKQRRGSVEVGHVASDDLGLGAEAAQLVEQRCGAGRVQAAA